MDDLLRPLTGSRIEQKLCSRLKEEGSYVPASSNRLYLNQV